MLSFDHRAATLVIVPILALTGGCSEDTNPFARSCAGRLVANCGVAYGASEVTAASLTPDEIGIDDFETPAVVDVSLETCAMDDIPRGHRVSFFAVIRPTDLPVDPLDGGVPAQRIELLGTVSDDGTDGDETARDGQVQGTIPPVVFDSDRGVPASSDIEILVQSAILDPDPPTGIGGDPFTCRSELFSIRYRTGAEVDRP